MPKSKLDQQVKDGTFLADNFGVSPQNAARLVTPDGVATEAVDRRIRKAHQPGDDATADLVVDTDETRRKPMLHGKNDRSGS